MSGRVTDYRSSEVWLHFGRWEEIADEIPSDVVVLTDPPYGMSHNTNSKRFTYGQRIKGRGQGRDDYARVVGDHEPFDPTPLLHYPKVMLFGSNHYAGRLPVGTTYVWIKKPPNRFGSFLSDAEIIWSKGGHGVYCYFQEFQPPSRMNQSVDGKCHHPNQKPVELLRWLVGKMKVERGTTIFDPYMGSGSIGVAAIKEGMKYIGAEIQEDYYRVARQRVANEEDGGSIKDMFRQLKRRKR